MNKPKNESHFYTIDQEISGYIVDSYGIDPKTAKGKLHKFVYYIYLCSFDQGNPMFHESTKKRTGFSSELIYIYELMFFHINKPDLTTTLLVSLYPDHYLILLPSI